MSVNDPTESMEKEQLNARIPRNLKTAASTTAAALNWKMEDVAMVAIAFALGTKDKTIRAKQRMMQQKALELGLSFNGPQSQPVGEHALAA